MHELYCPACNTPSQYNFDDYLLMCPFCSVTFQLEMESGQKDIYSDHYIVPNTLEAASVKHMTIEWLKRLHHRPGMVPKEYFIVDIQGFSIPYWIVSLEGHTAWKGLIQKKKIPGALSAQAGDYLFESGQFRRSYRWAISARKNICETWGFTRLHKPTEPIDVEWDGFPLDSTLSRGRLVEEEKGMRSAYDIRKFFEFKYANGLPILGIQVPETEALRRAKSHIQLYHYKLSKLNTDYLLDNRTELEIAGIQLIHIPFWKVGYIYQPKTALKHFMKPAEKKIIIDGYDKGILNGEIAVKHYEKILVNAVVCFVAALFMAILGALWHPAFFLVSGFAFTIAAISAALTFTRRAKEKEKQMKEHSDKVQNSASQALTA